MKSTDRQNQQREEYWVGFRGMYRELGKLHVQCSYGEEDGGLMGASSVDNYGTPE